MKELEEMTRQGESPLAISQLQAQLPNLQDSTIAFLAQDVRKDPERFINAVGESAALAFLQALKLEFEKRKQIFILDDVIEEGTKAGVYPRRIRRAVMSGKKRKAQSARRRAAKR